MKIQIRKIVPYTEAQACRIPPWYGFCYQEENAPMVVFYLIPFNIIVRIIRIIRFWLKNPRMWRYGERMDEIIYLRNQIKELEKKTKSS